MPLDKARDHPTLLRFLDKGLKELEACGILLRCADRLLHRCELPVENTRAGALGLLVNQSRPQARIGVEPPSVEGLERVGRVVELDELALFVVVFKP